MACNFIKKDALAQLFFCEFCKISKNTFFTKNLRVTASVIPFRVPLKHRKCVQKDLTLIITFRNSNCNDDDNSHNNKSNYDDNSYTVK